ncbi:MAG: hypothetical protein H6Q75_1107 [Firmicutes bacterium]|nr:hypothetical protein [Bacillota bacterium]
MSDNCCDNFQSAVDDYLIRHRSVLDVMTKYQETVAKVNRAIAKAVTECGCIRINSARQAPPAQASYCDLKQYMSSHLSGELCEQCREVIESEIGHSMFYMTALCTLLHLRVDDIMRKECKTVTTLGFFNLT